MRRLPGITASALMPLFVFAGTAAAASASAHAAPAAATGSGTASGTARIGARPAPPGCTATHLCFWVNVNFSDGPGQLAGTNASWFAFPERACQTGTWADCASSLYNDGTQCTARVWFLQNFGGPSLEIARGDGFSDLVNVPISGIPGANWNDNIEANDWVC